MTGRSLSFKLGLIGVVSLGLAVGLGYGLRAFASGTPSTNALSYAGVLEDATGPITGSHNIQVIFYDAATAGNELCQSPPATAVGVVNGHFSLSLPDSCTAAVAAGPNVWVDVLVDGSDTGRAKIGAVPYAIEANHTPNADNATPDGGIATSISGLQGSVTTLQQKLEPGPLFQVRNSTSAGAAGTTVVWNLVDVDTNSAYSTTTGLYKVPVAGTYAVYFDLLLPNAPAGEFRYGILHNGTLAHTTIAYKSTAGTWQSIYGSFLVNCAVGDTLGVEFVSGTGNTYVDPGFDVFQGHLLK